MEANAGAAGHGRERVPIFAALVDIYAPSSHKGRRARFLVLGRHLLLLK